LKEFLGGRRFKSDEEVKDAVKEWLNGLAAEVYFYFILFIFLYSQTVFTSWTTVVNIWTGRSIPGAGLAVDDTKLNYIILNLWVCNLVSHAKGRA
jgi:hypothetical protein